MWVRTLGSVGSRTQLCHWWLAFKSRNCVIPVVCVRTLGSVGSRTQLCHWWLAFKSRNCVIPVLCVRTFGSVGSRTQLCHWWLAFKSRNCVIPVVCVRTTSAFLYQLSWVVVYLSSTCLTINYLYFLFRYALLYFSIHSSVHFELFLICDLFSVCFICALSHTC